jgi:hypothetical protein
MTWDKGLNFRATSGYVTDGANETYVLDSDNYPVTRNAVTFGWTASIAGNSRDRDNTLDSRIAGVHFQTNDGTQKTFQVDLPAPGQYLIRLALGDTAHEAYLYCRVSDGATPLLTLDETTGNNPPFTNFFDATGTGYDSATWPGSNTPVTLTFSGTTLNLIIGSPAAQANVSTIAHLFISQITSGVSLAWIKA